MRKLIVCGLAATLSACVAGCAGSTPVITAQQIGCVTDAALAASSQTLTLTAAQKTAIAAGESVALIYCTSAPVAAGGVTAQ